MHAGEGIFVSNRAFLCRTGLFWCQTMHFAVEPGFFVWNESYKCSHFIVLHHCYSLQRRGVGLAVAGCTRGVLLKKPHVHGFFDTDLNEVSWHLATHEAVRPSEY